MLPTGIFVLNQSSLGFVKGTVHPQIVLLKCVMVIKVNKNFTIIVTNYSPAVVGLIYHQVAVTHFVLK
jgi:hypothetical protein